MGTPFASRSEAQLCPYGIIRTHGIGKLKKNGRRYIYLDYEPWPDARSIPFRRPATYPEIRAWVLREYGLTVNDKHVAQVKRKHGILTQGSQRNPLPESVNIPLEKETAIEAALRHFGVIP